MKQDMRVAVTRRMLREGMLRCMETRPISKITVCDLCRESGINRATFYNHYEAPVMILKELAHDYYDHLSEIYRSTAVRHNVNDEKALEACFQYLYDHRQEIKILFSPNAENCLDGFGYEIVKEAVEKRTASVKPASAREEDSFLLTVTVSAAVYGLVQTWLKSDIDRTPRELVDILKQALRVSIFF